MQPANLAKLDNFNQLLMVAYAATQTPAESGKCRFDLFVRVRPGINSTFKDQQRCWCYRGDKYTDQEPRMLRNLISLAAKRFEIYDRLIISDHHKTGEEKIILKVVDGVVEINRLNIYSFMLLNFNLPLWLK